jgi:hypothetical protein
MTEANADYFYGRTCETAAAVTALVDKPGRCPILIGASGVGKSSVAQPGVFSALKSMRWPGVDHGDQDDRGRRSSKEKRDQSPVCTENLIPVGARENSSTNGAR